MGFEPLPDGWESNAQLVNSLSTSGGDPTNSTGQSGGPAAPRFNDWFGPAGIGRPRNLSPPTTTSETVAAAAPVSMENSTNEQEAVAPGPSSSATTSTTAGVVGGGSIFTSTLNTNSKVFIPRSRQIQEPVSNAVTAGSSTVRSSSSSSSSASAFDAFGSNVGDMQSQTFSRPNSPTPSTSTTATKVKKQPVDVIEGGSRGRRPAPGVVEEERTAAVRAPSPLFRPIGPIPPFVSSWERHRQQLEAAVAAEAARAADAAAVAADPPDEPMPRTLRQLFRLVEQILAQPAAPNVAERQASHSREYNIVQMDIVAAVIKKLFLAFDQPGLTEGHFVRITQAIHQLQQHLDELDRKYSSRYPLHLAIAQGLFHKGDTTTLLKPYDGDILNWSHFWASYCDLVASNSALSDLSKYSLLYDNLDESTRQVINLIEPGHPQLRVAYTRLIEHITDHTTVLHGLVASLKKLPIVKNAYRKENWQRLLQVTQQIRQFIRVREDRAEIDMECTVILIGKLSPLHSEDYFAATNSDFRLEHFEAFVTQKIATLDEMLYMYEDLDSVVVPEELCLFCIDTPKSDYHYPEKCTVPVEERRAKVKTLGLCMRCLAEKYFHGHVCGLRCAHCNGDHHIAVCYSFRPTIFAKKTGRSYVGPPRYDAGRRGNRDTHHAVPTAEDQARLKALQSAQLPPITLNI